MTQKITGAYLVRLIQKNLGTENTKSNLCFNFRIQFGFRSEKPISEITHRVNTTVNPPQLLPANKERNKAEVFF